MKIKKIAASLLSCAVLGGVLPFSSGVTGNSAITVSAADGTYESLIYINYGDFILISGCDQSVTEVVIPGEIEGLPVTSIGDHAFKYCSDLTSIEIPDSVTSIGDSAFDSCSSLTSIIIPDGVTSIGNSAFDSCSSLTSITIPDGVTSIGSYAFSSCSSLTSVEIPDSITSIGYQAFSFCSSLTSISIPSSVTSIGKMAFYNTLWLDSQRKISPLVIVNKILIDGETCEGDIVIPDGVTSIGSSAFHSCSGLTSITIPDSVASIEQEAFYGCSGLTSISIPDGVTSIGETAFGCCFGLTSITIPDSVTSIEVSAFYGCEKLTSITINNPECEIYDSEFTFTNDLLSGLTATIYGYENSTAQAYAEKYGRNFKILGETSTTTTPAPTLSGDADLDGKVGISDVVKVMMYVANKEANPLSEQGIINADVYNNGDGVFISDALSIQKKVAQIIDTLPES